MPRHAAKVDANQHPIVKALRDIFGPDCVFDLSAVGKGCPDILFSCRGVNLLLEIKTDNGALTPAQIRFHRKWPGQVDTVRSLEEALRVIERETT